jgi:aminocarboxymuconate-semialdehyde decarboxylase
MRSIMKQSTRTPRGARVDRREFVKLAAGAGAVTMFKGRSVSAQAPSGRRIGSIDMHAHWQPEAYVKMLEQIGAPITPNPLNVDLDKRRKWMDDHGVQLHVLTLLLPPWQWAPAGVAARLTQAVNDAAIEAHTAFPDRFVAGVAMPVQNPALALKELNRVAGKPAFRAVHLPNSLNGADYVFEPAFEPILARCEELGYPLLFHPVTVVPGVERLSGSPNLVNPIGFPLEHTIVAAKFITSGVLDKFPKLDVVLFHAGGMFPYIAGRLEHSLNRTSLKLARPFRDYIRRFHYDTITYYPETLRFLIELVGSDRVVIGTDNFAAMDLAEPNALVEQLNLRVAERDRIFRGNALKLLRL